VNVSRHSAPFAMPTLETLCKERGRWRGFRRKFSKYAAWVGGGWETGLPRQRIQLLRRTQLASPPQLTFADHVHELQAVQRRFAASGEQLPRRAASLPASVAGTGSWRSSSWSMRSS
jgi:hypothetical protein